MVVEIVDPEMKIVEGSSRVVIGAPTVGKVITRPPPPDSSLTTASNNRSAGPTAGGADVISRSVPLPRSMPQMNVDPIVVPMAPLTVDVRVTPDCVKVTDKLSASRSPFWGPV